MKQKSRIVSKLFAALVILTLISCCFLGSTFARYTSQSTGTASVGVAKWDVTVDGTDMDEKKIEVNFNKLSPSMNVYDGTNPRTHTTSPKLIATVSNYSDVKVDLTVQAGNAKYYNESTTEITDDWGIYNKDIIDEVFSINFYWSNSATWGAEDAQSGTIDSIPQLAETNDTVYIYASITWTSDSSNYSGENADARDTWIGKNIASVGWDLTLTAVQASELPGNN